MDVCIISRCYSASQPLILPLASASFLDGCPGVVTFRAAFFGIGLFMTGIPKGGLGAGGGFAPGKGDKIRQGSDLRFVLRGGRLVNSAGLIEEKDRCYRHV